MKIFNLIAAFILSIGVSTSAYSIVGGSPDCNPSDQNSNCTYPSVGFMAWTLDEGTANERAAPACSAVLIYKSASVAVVLTAAHCPIFGTPQVNFDAKAWRIDPNLIDTPFSSAQLFNGTFQANPPTYLKVDHLFIHPQSMLPSADIAVLVINNPAKLSTINSLRPGLQATSLPRLGYLDGIDKSELYRKQFTAVGHGLSWVTLHGSAPAQTYPIITSGERAVALIKLRNLTAEGTVTLNTNTNFYDDGYGGMALGDSGGAIYYGDQLVGLPALHFFPVYGGGPRLDTSMALNFICPIISAYKSPSDPLPSACTS